VTSRSTIRAGDVVQLIRTGVKMTVGECDDAGVNCTWFGIDDAGEWTGPHRRHFRYDEVTPVQDAEN